MIVQINPKEFITNFVNPTNELNKEGKLALFSNGTELYSLSTTKARTIHLYNTYKPINIENYIERVSINVLKLIKGLQCISTDNHFISINFSKETSVCSFATNEIKFNIRLLDDNLVDVPRFNIETFNKFEIHHTINISVDKVNNIKKALAFSTDAVKFYLEQEGESIFFFFGEKNSTSNHLDDIRILVADDVKTEVPKKIYDIDILQFVLKSKNDFSMKMNNNGVMFIEIDNTNSNLKYITAPLIK